MNERTANLNRAVKAGTAWMLIERGGIQFLNIVSSIVLARLLVPRDFGVLGVATIFTGLSTRLVKFGFGMALVRRETIRPDHVSALFLLTLITNSLVCLVLIAISPFVGHWFQDDPLAGPVLAVMSLNFLIRCVGACPSALLRRELNFRANTIGGFADGIVRLIVAAGLAYKGWGVWALVYGELIGGLADKVVLFHASRWWPSLRTTRAAIKDLFSFGMGVSLKSTCIYLTENVDNAIVGNRLGTSILGSYEKAYDLMNLPVAEISTRMNNVLFPVFARIHKDTGRLRAALRKTILSLSLVGYPVFGTLLVLAPQFITIMYGRKWASAIVPFQLLCIAGPPRILSNIISSVINAMGSIGPEVKQRTIVFVLLVAGALLGSRWGITGVSVAVALVNLAAMVMILLLVCRVSPVEFSKDIWRPQWIPFAGTVPLIGVEYLCRQWATGAGLGVFATAAVASAAGGGIYLLVLVVARDRSLTALVQEFRADLRPLLVRVPLARSFV